MEYRLSLPVDDEKILKIKAGDIIYLNGKVATLRDEGHKRAIEGREQPINFSEVAIYHCGPIVKKDGNEWRIIAAGPTTSMRMEMFEYDFIKKFNTKIIIGKGGMGKKTAEACKKFKALYAAFTGGAAVLAAKLLHLKDVFWLDLGMPEALWLFEAEQFGPLVVTIDAHGNNLTEDIKNLAERKAKEKGLV